MISQAEAEQKFYSGREQADAATSDLIRTALRMSLDLIKDDDDDDELARTVAYSETVTNCVAIYFNDLIRGDFPDGVIVDRHLLRKLGIKPGWESIEEDNDFERLDNELASAVER
ncbi:MAG: hypothetical protein M3458_19685, partial [Acidobacteriota bacterium]|nr:hypothetical protein [Acidobacteriota bacterium]